MLQGHKSGNDTTGLDRSTVPVDEVNTHELSRRTGTLGGNDSTQESLLDTVCNGELPYLTLYLFI